MESCRKVAEQLVERPSSHARAEQRTWLPSYCHSAVIMTAVLQVNPFTPSPLHPIHPFTPSPCHSFGYNFSGIFKAESRPILQFEFGSFSIKCDSFWPSGEQAAFKMWLTLPISAAKSWVNFELTTREHAAPVSLPPYHAARHTQRKSLTSRKNLSTSDTAAPNLVETQTRKTWTLRKNNSKQTTWQKQRTPVDAFPLTSRLRRINREARPNASTMFSRTSRGYGKSGTNTTRDWVH